MTALAHLTIGSGHTVLVPRERVDEQAMLWADAALRVALEHGAAQLLPPHEGYGLRVERFGAALLITVIGRQAPGDPFTPIVAFGVSPASRRGRALWRRLGELAVLGGPDLDAAPEPPAPWCAVAILPGLLDHPDAAGWLGPVEQALAWAWIEREAE